MLQFITPLRILYLFCRAYSHHTNSHVPSISWQTWQRLSLHRALLDSSVSLLVIFALTRYFLRISALRQPIIRVYIRVRLSTSRSSTQGSLPLLSNVSIDAALALRICFLLVSLFNYYQIAIFLTGYKGCHKICYSNIFGSVVGLDYKEST